MCDKRIRLGRIEKGQMRLNALGQAVADAWYDLPRHYPHVRLDAFVVMPDHAHGIVQLLGYGNGRADGGGPVGAGLKPATTAPTARPDTSLPGPTPTPPPTDAAPRRHGLSEIMRAWKTFSARRINILRGTPGEPVWQRDYYESIIRDHDGLNRVRRYIEYNPLRWAERRK